MILDGCTQLFKEYKMQNIAWKFCLESFPWHWFFTLLLEAVRRSKVYTLSSVMACYVDMYLYTKSRTQLFLWFCLSHTACFGDGTFKVDSFVYFYCVIALLSIFRDILSPIMFLNPRSYCANGKISGRNKNMVYEAVILFSFQNSKHWNCQGIKIWRICDT